MNFCAQRLLSKLPKDIFGVEGSQCRGLGRLSCSNNVDRARPFLAAVRYKDFRFACTVSLHTLSAQSSSLRHVRCAETGSVLVFCQRHSSSDKQASGTSNEKKLVEARESPYAHLTTGQKVKEAGKDATYLVVILVGVAVTGLMFYLIGTELFSSQSPSGVYGDALKKCQNSLEVTAALGEPLKGYGETTRRGRRRHVSHTEFEVNGIPHMRMRFYIEGPYRKATVHVEVQKDDSGKYQYRYLVVETEGYPHRTFVLEDNR